MSTNQQTRITRPDLKFYPSERLTDNDDGGGFPLGTPIKAEANEIFNPISSIARVNGAFNARFIYAGVQRLDDEPLIGAYTAITRPPKDSSVSYLLFPATKFGETREEILKRIEAYSVGTIESRMTLLSTQSQNSKIIQAYQRVGEPLPLVGDVFCLRQNKAGYPQHEQYVQVVSVESENRTFTSNKDNKEFMRTVVKLEISSKLEADFIGAEYPSEGYLDVPCKIRETHVADAAQYYGIKPLAAAIAKEQAQIQITGLMEKLVPTNQIETKLTDLTAGGVRQTLYDASKRGDDGVITLAVNKSHSAGSNTSLYVGNAITPNSVVIKTSTGDITDKGGTLINSAGTALGSVMYASGELLITEPTFSAAITSVAFRPASAERQVADTASQAVDINNRSYNWTLTLPAAPAVGTLMVSYRAQGRWYDLMDDGTGALKGMSAAHGSGNINFATNTITVECGELPDVGSMIMYSWGTQARYFNRADSQPVAYMVLPLVGKAVPRSLSLGWQVGDDTYQAFCDARGNITGDWTGIYDAKTQQILINVDEMFSHPDGKLEITAAYSTGEGTPQNITLYPADDGTVTFTLNNLKPNTLRLSYSPQPPDGYVMHNNNVLNEVYIIDDGVGNLLNINDEIVGTINYDTGKGSFNPEIQLKLAKAIYDVSEGMLRGDGTGRTIESSRFVLKGYEYNTVLCTLNISTTALVQYISSNSDTSITEQLPSGNLIINLLPNFSETIIPASVNLTWGGKTYFDRGGSILTDLDVKTGSATQVGSIDYGAGIITLTDWQLPDDYDGTPPTLNGLVTAIDGNPVDAVTFRTPTSPLRAGSLQISAVTLDGTPVTATADYAGNLKGDGINGVIDTQYGVADVRFGRYLNAVDVQNEPWYDQNAVVDGKIWQSVHVFASTISYSTVAYSYLPIDSNVVKIDTVRLPQDGRIPIFRRGDNILISNSQTDDIGSAHTGGQTVPLSRSDVDRICVTDSDGTPVNAELWDYDLDVGTITWTTPLDLSEYKMPLTVTHVQEERNRILQADIDGTLSLIFPTKRAYPLDGTYVSSLLVSGDLQVRMSVPFTQRNFNGVWADEPIGEQLLNKLNLKDYPATLTDDGAITERWMIKMTSSNNLELWGETLGYVGKFDTLTDLAPINPATGKPYFTIPKQAFGADAPWQAQDIIRFNTWGTLLPVWVLRAVQPTSNVPEGEDGFTMCLFGDTTEIAVN